MAGPSSVLNLYIFPLSQPCLVKRFGSAKVERVLFYFLYSSELGLLFLLAGCNLTTLCVFYFFYHVVHLSLDLSLLNMYSVLDNCVLTWLNHGPFDYSH
jgi:hypothetical protein